MVSLYATQKEVFEESSLYFSALLMNRDWSFQALKISPVLNVIVLIDKRTEIPRSPSLHAKALPNIHQHISKPWPF